jgi:hypothetical protein
VNERQRSILVVVVCAVLIAIAFFGFVEPYLGRERAVNKILNANSTWTVTMQQYLHDGPVSEQTYRISNDNGKVTMFFSATNRDGLITKQFEVPLSGPEATFLFEQLYADGIWELPDKAVLPHPRDEYVFFVQQQLGNEGGQRAFAFSDPVFWAMTHGQEYPLNLKDTQHPIGVTSTPLRDARYLKIVRDMESFGPASVQQAEAKIRGELAASNGHPPSRTGAH